MNVTRKTVMTVLMLPMLMVIGGTKVNAQELEGPLLNVSPSLLGIQDLETSAQASVSDEPRQDKWALTDEDRMTDEEMDSELFGGSKVDEKVLNAKPNADGGTSIERAASPPTLAEPTKDIKPTQLVSKQSIESYLRNINSLTIATHTVSTTRPDGVDVPMRLIPPQSNSSSFSSTSTALQFQTPDIHHRPLYFEDQDLERYGIHRCRRQPFESARKFISDTVSLPCEVVKQPPASCVYRANLRYDQPLLIPANR